MKAWLQRIFSTFQVEFDPLVITAWINDLPLLKMGRKIVKKRSGAAALLAGSAPFKSRSFLRESNIAARIAGITLI
jgi:hypothetical protein